MVNRTGRKQYVSQKGVQKYTNICLCKKECTICIKINAIYRYSKGYVTWYHVRGMYVTLKFLASRTSTIYLVINYNSCFIILVNRSRWSLLTVGWLVTSTRWPLLTVGWLVTGTRWPLLTVGWLVTGTRWPLLTVGWLGTGKICFMQNCLLCSKLYWTQRPETIIIENDPKLYIYYGNINYLFFFDVFMNYSTLKLCLLKTMFYYLEVILYNT